MPIDNSATERELKNVETCRTVGPPVQAASWAFERLSTHRDVFALPLEAMTPATFKNPSADNVAATQSRRDAGFIPLSLIAHAARPGRQRSTPARTTRAPRGALRVLDAELRRPAVPAAAAEALQLQSAR